MALMFHIGIQESCGKGPAATIPLPHQTDDHDDDHDDDYGYDDDVDPDDHPSPSLD